MKQKWQKRNDWSLIPIVYGSTGRKLLWPLLFYKLHFKPNTPTPFITRAVDELDIYMEYDLRYCLEYKYLKSIKIKSIDSTSSFQIN